MRLVFPPLIRASAKKTRLPFGVTLMPKPRSIVSLMNVGALFGATRLSMAFLVSFRGGAMLVLYLQTKSVY